MTARLRPPVSRLRWPARKALATGAVVAVLALLATGVTASADTTGWNAGTLCTSNSPGTSSPPDACDTMHDGGGHGIDVHTSQGNMQAICVYDYAGNPSSCEQTAVAAYNGQGTNLTRPALAAAVEILPVEARHAAWVRDLVGKRPAPLAQDQLWSATRATQTLARTGLLGT